jgi:hypothetical protein
VNTSEPAKVIASIFALAAFAVAIVAGLAAGNTSARVLTTAVVAMIVCQLIGQGVGAIGEWVVNEHVSSERNKHAASETNAARPAAAPAS